MNGKIVVGFTAGVAATLLLSALFMGGMMRRGGMMREDGMMQNQGLTDDDSTLVERASFHQDFSLR